MEIWQRKAAGLFLACAFGVVALDAQVRELDYTQRSSGIEQKRFPTPAFQAPVKDPSQLRFDTNRRGGSRMMGSNQPTIDPASQTTRLQTSESRFARRTSSFSTEQKAFSTDQAPRAFRSGANMDPWSGGAQRIEGSGQVVHLDKVRQNTLNQSFQRVIDQSMEVGRENREGEPRLSWNRGVPHPSSGIEIPRVEGGRDFSLQDINRFQFRRTRSSTPGLPHQDAGGSR